MARRRGVDLRREDLNPTVNRSVPQVCKKVFKHLQVVRLSYIYRSGRDPYLYPTRNGSRLAGWMQYAYRTAAPNG